MQQSSLYRSIGEKEPKDSVVVHTTCAHNPIGMTKSSCQAMTLVVMRNHQGCCGVPSRGIAPCTSRDRVCRVCVTQPGQKNTVVDPRTGLCKFHTEHGERAVQAFTGYARSTPSVELPRRVAAAPSKERSTHEPVRHKDIESENRVKHAKIKEKLTPNVALMLDHGHISTSQARRLAGKYANRPSMQEALAEQLRQNKISVRDL